MSETKIKPEDWIVEITCPNCHRPRRVHGVTRRSGITILKDVIIPQICVYCELEKNQEVQ